MADIIYTSVIPGIKDDRDYRYSQKKVDLKESVDLREWDSPVEDQQFLGSCVANAIANAYELSVKKLYPDKFVNLSRLFIYYNSRLFDNNINYDSGTYIRDGLKSAARYGICSEELWPYIETNFNIQPSPKCYIDATNRTITKYETLYSLRDLLEVLNDNRSIVIGMVLYSNFMLITAKDSVLNIPSANKESIGNHAVTIVGYDLEKQLFLAKNSFGNSWGDKGYFWISFEYMRTQVFEKWCFDISSQMTISFDSGNKSNELIDLE